MARKPQLIKINPEHLSPMQESDINIPRGDIFQLENECCKAIKNIGYFTFPKMGVARLNVNFCFCCGRKIIR